MALIVIDWNPERRVLRQFGGLAAALLGFFGLLVGWRHRFFGIQLTPDTAFLVAAILLFLGLLSALAALLEPSWMRPAYVGLTVLGYPIGYVVSHVVMALIFFGLITPIGLVLRATGRDPLDKGLDRKAETYWVRRGPPAEPSRYFHQF